MNYNLIMIATHRDNLNIFNLIENLDNIYNELSLLLVLVSQESSIKYTPKRNNLTIKFIDEKKVGLSKARNIGLNYLLKNNISSEYIMFPDDDSTFDSTFFKNFKNILDSKKCYITPIYNCGTKELYLGKKIKENTLLNEDSHKFVGSPNQVILYEKFKDEIYFDENLGVGSNNGSCEDYDLYIRLNRIGAKFYTINEIYNFHPSKKNKNKISIEDLIKRYKNYSLGYQYIAKKYNKKNILFSYLTRPLLATIINLLMLNFKMSRLYITIYIFRLKLVYKIMF